MGNSLLPLPQARACLREAYCNIFINLRYRWQPISGAVNVAGMTREENQMRTRRRATLTRKTRCAWSPRRKLKLADMKRKIWHRNRSYTLLIAEHTTA